MRVFDKFFRVEHQRPAADGEPRGAGIGLYLARQIVEAHGGAIRCGASPRGQGATIVLELPIGDTEIESIRGYDDASRTAAPSSHGAVKSL